MKPLTRELTVLLIYVLMSVAGLAIALTFLPNIQYTVGWIFGCLATNFGHWLYRNLK